MTGAGRVLFTSAQADVTPGELERRFCDAGLTEGDVVMVHARLFSLGRLPPSMDKDTLADAFINVLRDIVGPSGTLLFPTFTLGVCRTGHFDVDQMPSEMGLLSERARLRHESVRTHHPFFSIAVMGAHKSLFMSSRNDTCFGEGSVFDVMHGLNQADGTRGKMKFLTLGMDLPPAAITYIHSIEEKLAVPYRYHKAFTGSITTTKGQASPYQVSMFVRDLSVEVEFDAKACWDILADREEVVTLPLGASTLSLVPEHVIYSTLLPRITQQQDFLCKGGYFLGASNAK